jgi:hypothetical protein
MADTENSSSSFFKWVGGIAASVITAVLIYHFTNPPQPPPPPPTVAPTAVNGIVADSTSHELIRNAVVTVALGPNSAHQATDALGRYSVVLASTSADPNMGNVDVQAPGHLAYSNTVLLRPGDNYAEITIDAVPPTPPTVAAAPAGAPAPVAAPTPAASPTLPPATAPTPGAGGMNPALVARARIVLKAPPPGYTKAITTYSGVAPGK